MSSVVISGLSSWYRSTASTPLPPRRSTSCPPLVSASRQHLPHEGGVVDYEDAGHRRPPPSVMSAVGDELAGWRSTVSIRTAHSSVDHDAGGRWRSGVPLTKRSIGSSARAVELDHRAGRQADGLAERHPRAAELGPDAHRDAARPAPAMRVAAARRRAARGRGSSAGELVERARHADDEGVRDELDEPARLAEMREGDARRVRRALGRRRGRLGGVSEVCVSGAPISTSSPSTFAGRAARRRPSSGSSPRPTAESSSSDSSARPDPRRLHAHHRGGELARAGQAS